MAQTSPTRLVAEALTYLQNHKDKMRYDEYRRQGLPITSSHMESLMKQSNQRVKGSEKFCCEEAPKRFCNCVPMSSATPDRSTHSGNAGKPARLGNGTTGKWHDYKPCRAPVAGGG